MKRFFLLLMLWPTVLLAQLNESFSDGEILNNPTWFGQVDSFIVNGDYKLQLDALVAGSSFIYTQSDAIEDASWTFEVINQFSPSSSNYTRIFLTMDNPDPENIKYGVYCDVGRNSDRLELGIIKDGNEEVIIESEDGLFAASTNSININISRNEDLWQLSYNVGNGEIVLDSVTYPIRFASAWFGILCTYTKTRAKKFIFDNIIIKGESLRDRYTPEILMYHVTNGEEIIIQFNESLDETSFDEKSFYLSKLKRYASLVIYNEDQIVLSFSPALDDVEEEKLVVSNLADLSGNLLSTELLFSFKRVKVEEVKTQSLNELCFSFSRTIPLNSWTEANLLLNNKKVTHFEVVSSMNDFEYQLKLTSDLDNGAEYLLQLSNLKDDRGDTIRTFSQTISYYQPQRFDVVLNEIMADPTPQVSLPESEYIELFNRSEFDLSLNDWKIQVGDKVAYLPDSVIKSGTYCLLIPSAKLNEWSDEVVAVTKWPTLSNSGFGIALYDGDGSVIDAFIYDLDQIGGDKFKYEGGWSAERVDVNNMSGGANNWFWSVDHRGGSPSAENSLIQQNNDVDAPWIVFSELVNDTIIRIHFNEVMDILKSNWSISIQPEVEFCTNVDSVFMQYVDIKLNEIPDKNKEHQVTFNSLFDWAGNGLMDNILRIAKTDTLTKNDVIINEILFNPFIDGVDFVELVNASNKVINLSDLCFASWDEDKIIDKLYPITDKSRMLFPGDYIVLSEDSLVLFSQYYCENKNAFLNTKLPSMPDDEGAIVLCNQAGEIIDFIEYSKDMHFDLIRNEEGVSLERLAIDQPTRDHQNWHSAASSVLATPGYLNSQTITDKNSVKTIALDYDLFTPNGNGDKDQLIIRYSNKEPDGTMSIRIFDSAGHEVRYLINNQLMKSDGYYLWDGLDDQGQKLTPGIYIIWVQRVYASGNIQENKMVCVIGVKD
nr:lamin tail domain-containing protein [uncultured Carboxylicivirga sp.]